MVINKTWNGTEWKMLIKHGTELLSRHKAHLRTHGPRSYTHANCSCTRPRRERLADRLLIRLAGNGWETDYAIPAHTRIKRDATAQYNHDDDNEQFSVVMHFTYCSPQEDCSYSGNLQLMNLTSYLHNN